MDVGWDKGFQSVAQVLAWSSCQTNTQRMRKKEKITGGLRLSHAGPELIGGKLHERPTLKSNCKRDVK